MSNAYPTRLERKIERASRKLSALQVRQWMTDAKPQKHSALKALGRRLAAPLALVDRAWYDARTIADKQRADRDRLGPSILEFLPDAERYREETQERNRRIEALKAAATEEPCPGCSGQLFRCVSFLPPEQWCEPVLLDALREELEIPLSTDLGVAWLERLEEQDEQEWSPDEPPVLSELCQDALTLAFFWLLSSWSFSSSLIASAWRGLRSRVFRCRKCNSSSPQHPTPNTQPPAASANADAA